LDYHSHTTKTKMMSEKEIVWHYNEFVEIQIEVDKKIQKSNITPDNEKHEEQIKEIIKETVLEFKRWL